MRKFFSIINNTLYYGFVIAVLGVTGAMFMMRSDALGGMELKIVRSGSMEPAIETGALIAVREAATYQVGDVITFGADTATQIPTTHRIMEVEKNAGATTFVTQGDANENIDPTPVAASSVIGKVVYSAPKVGYIFDFARQPLGFLLLIGIPAGLIILDELLVMFGEAKRIMGRKKVKGEKVTERHGRRRRNTLSRPNHSSDVARPQPVVATPAVATFRRTMVDPVVPTSRQPAPTQSQVTASKQNRQPASSRFDGVIFIPTRSGQAV